VECRLLAALLWRIPLGENFEFVSNFVLLPALARMIATGLGQGKVGKYQPD
jgi:hypothetical protein